MANVAVIGAQWGDEGKGKVVDWLASRAEIVVRFQGGHNAGHTLVVGNQTYKLSLLPSGLVRGKLGIIGNGVVIDPEALLAEMDRVRAQGLEVSPATLRIAENAVLILPVHGALDRAREAARGERKIGTTGRGIGPAYEDKVARRAIRACDLAEPETLAAKLDELLLHHNTLLKGLGAEPFEKQALLDRLLELAPRLLPHVEPVWERLDEARRAGTRILFEGAQAVMLDVDHGTYPFVTSSNTIAATAAAGSGIGPASVGFVLGIAKAYTTRVGSGPFPTELTDETGTAARHARARVRHRHRPPPPLRLVRRRAGPPGGQGRRHPGPGADQARRAGRHERAQDRRRLRDRRQALQPSSRRPGRAGRGAPDLRDDRRLVRHPPAAPAPGPNCRRRRSNTSAASRNWWKRRSPCSQHQPRARRHHPDARPVRGLIDDPRKHGTQA